MTGAVQNKLNQAARFSKVLQDRVGYIQISLLAFSPDVVDLTLFSMLNNEIDCPAVILNMNPVANVLPIAINWQRLVRERLRDHQWDEFLRKLERAVIIGTPGNNSRESMRLYVRES